METLPLSSFLFEMLDRQRLPLNGTLELTFRCNMKCAFCYCPAPQSLQGKREMSTAELRRIIDEIADAGCLTLLLTGGEPLLRHDFAEIYPCIRRHGIFVTLFTNGTLLDAKTADLLCRFPPKKIEITLYGATEATHEKVTGVPGSFAACNRGIELLIERRLPLALKSTISIDNYHEIPLMKEFAAGLGLEYRCDPMLDPRIDGEQTPCRYRIPTHQVVDLDLQDAEKMSGLRRLCAHKPRTVDRRLVYVCGAGEGSFYIDPCGRMSMCGLTRYAAYDLSRGSFKQGFYDHFEALRSQRLKEGEVAPCAECDLINLCTNCPGTAYLENASLTLPSPFHCEVARLRAREVASLR